MSLFEDTGSSTPPKGFHHERSSQHPHQLNYVRELTLTHEYQPVATQSIETLEKLLVKTSERRSEAASVYVDTLPVRGANGISGKPKKKRVRLVATGKPKWRLLEQQLNLRSRRPRVQRGEGGDTLRSAAQSSPHMQSFVGDTTQPEHAMFGDYREMGLDALMEQHYRVNKMSYYLEVQANLTSHLGRSPTVTEWAGSLNMGVQDLKKSIVKSQRVKMMLVRRNAGLVAKVAQAYRGRGVPFRDLLQEGSVGLIDAAERFDPALGFQFSTYATQWVRKYVSSALVKHGRAIRLPQRAHEEVVKLEKTRSRMEALLGRDPTLDEVATEARFKPAKAKLLAASAQAISSLDQAIGKAAGTTRSDLIADPNPRTPAAVAEHAALKGELDQLLALLPSLERQVVILRFGLLEGKPHSYEEVIARIPELMDKKSVIKAETRALYKLRKPSTVAKMSQLRDYLNPRSS